MAQRTVLRMSLAQMRATREDEQPPPLGTAASDDTIYFVTLDIVKSNDPKEPHVWGITFGPSRSREHAFQFVARSYPNTQAVMREIGNFNRMVWEENNHFRWEDQNGDKYTLRLEQVRSAAVRASSQEEVFMVIRTVEPFGEEPGAHHSNIEGVFLNDSDATTFAVRSMRNAIEGQTVVDHFERRKPDGMMICIAQSSGQCGFRYGFEVDRLPWCSSP